MTHPMQAAPRPPFDTPRQSPPGLESAMIPRPDFGESSYVGSGKHSGKSALMDKSET
ncbi:hypothetical protein [Variovorax sp. OV084]|nr:hypothetical protein [Variovorax sp. OV084]SEU21738.1 hypothetical protein SAMN05443580_13115 [Variovorax sp. OV084]